MSRRTGLFILCGLVVALVLAAGVSRFASSEPDGLNRVAIDHGLDASERPHDLESGTFAGYGTKGVSDDGLGTGIAGFVGVIATFAVAGGVVWGASRLQSSRRRSTATL